jgi:hypothetical protein
MYKIGEQIEVNGIIVVIVKIDSFGGEKHYGVMWQENGKDRSGWVVCSLVD